MSDEVMLRQQYRITTLVAAAMLGAIAAYAAVVTILQYQQQTFAGFAPEKLASLREGFLLVILFVLVGARMIRKGVLKKEPGDPQEILVNRLRTATILTFALCEIPAILGLVLFFLGGTSKDFYSLALVSVAFMALYFPRYRHWASWVAGSSGIY